MNNNIKDHLFEMRIIQAAQDALGSEYSQKGLCDDDFEDFRVAYLSLDFSGSDSFALTGPILSP